MNRKSLNVWLVILGIVFVWKYNAQADSCMLNIVQEELPSARIVATGKGYPPNRNVSSAQKRMLAKRAATIDAYRVLASIVNGISGYIVEGQGFVKSSGFVKGAEVSDVKYFANGKVEVDVIVPVNLVGNKSEGKLDWDMVVNDISRKGYSVCYSERPVKQISEEEWMQMRSKNTN